MLNLARRFFTRTDWVLLGLCLAASVFGIIMISSATNLNGSGDSDTNTSRISRGTKLGLQFPDDFDHELLYTVEYRDYPLFDAIDIILYDKNSDFNSEF